MASNNIKGLTVEISGDSTKLTEALKPINSAAKKSAAELKEINRGLKFDPSNTTLLAQKQKVLAEAIGTSKDKLKLLQEAEKSAQEQFARGEIGEEQMRALQREVIAAENDLKKLESQYASLGSEAKKAGSELERSGDDIAKVGLASEDASGKVSSFGDILKGSLAANVITDGLRAIKNGINSIASDTIAAGSTAETAMAKLSTIADTEKLPLKDLQSQIIELSNNTGESVADLAESVYSAISGGVDTADAVSVVGKATQLASGGFTSTATAIDVLTTAINAYGLSTDDAAKLSDYLLTTQNLGKTTVDELAGAMGKVIPLASAYGVQMDNLSSAYAIMTANGIATTESTTYLKSMLKELGDSGSTVSAVLAEQTGKSFAELNAEGMSLGDILAILGDSVDGDTGKFNELWSSSEAGIGALSILGTGTERYTEVLNAMRDSAGATETAYTTMTDTFEHKSETLKNTLKNLEIEGFDGFKQSFKGAMDAINKELQSDKTKNAVKKLGKSIGTLTTNISKVASKVLPKLADALSFVVKNAGKLAISVGSAVVAIKGFKIASTATSFVKSLTTAFRGFSDAVAANPVGLAVTAISGLISIFTSLDAAIDTDREKLDRLSDAYQDAADAAIAAQQERADAAHLIDEEYDGYRDLMKELDGIVDANGKIKTGYEERAAFITGKLSEAAGIEIEITDGVIQKYSELSNMLDTILIKKQAEALLTSQQGDYQTAKSAIGSTETDEDGNYIAGSQAAYEAANAEYQNAVKTVEAYDRGMRYFKNRIDVLNTLLASGAIDNNTYTYRQQQIAIDRRIFEDKYKDYDYVFDPAKLDQKKQIADDARLAYDAYIAVIDNYENLQTAVWSEDTDAMRDAIVDASNAQMKAGKASLASLKQQRDNAIESYNTYLEWSRREESSVSPADIAEKRNQALQAALEVHQQMLNESTQHTEEELEASKLEIETALSEIGGLTDKQISTILRLMETGGFDAGKFFGEGIIAGMSSTETKIFEAGGRLGNAGMAGYNRTMEIASPSKRARRSGRFTGLGVALGLEDEVETVTGKAVLLADAIAAELDGDLPMHAVTIAQGGYFKRGDSIDSLGVSVSIEAVFARLDAILTAVREIDPCMVLDDGTIVAKTAEKTNDALGIIATRERRGRF